MIKKFLRGFILGVLMMISCVVGVALFIKGIETFDHLMRVHKLDPLLYGGIIYILIGAVLYGVLTAKNKV